MSTSGFYWITNLTEADPYYILPIAVGLCNLLTIEVLFFFLFKFC